MFVVINVLVVHQVGPPGSQKSTAPRSSCFKEHFLLGSREKALLHWLQFSLASIGNGEGHGRGGVETVTI